MKKALRIFIKIGIFLSIIMFSEWYTYSFFTSSYKGALKVSAAKASQILKSIKIDETNPKYIELEGSDELADDSAIYFLIEGEAAEYIDHINPVKIKKGEKINIPIAINMSLPEAVNLIKNRNSTDTAFINGTIWVKYLNDFINLPYEFKFSNEYLLNEFMSSLNYSKKYTNDEKDMIIPYLTDIIIYTAGYGKWDKVVLSNGQDEENAVKNIVPKLEMTKYQKSILDIVTPQLNSQIAELYSIIESNIFEDDSLNSKIQEIEEENARIKEQN